MGHLLAHLGAPSARVRGIVVVFALVGLSCSTDNLSVETEAADEAAEEQSEPGPVDEPDDSDDAAVEPPVTDDEEPADEELPGEEPSEPELTEGCAGDGSGTFAPNTGDIDRDGQPDMIWGFTGEGGTAFGVETAAGATSGIDFADGSFGDGSTVPVALVAPAQDGLPTLIFVQSGQLAGLYTFENCALRPATNDGGGFYEFAIGAGASQFGTGVGCTDVNGRFELVGLNIVRGDDASVDWERTIIELDGTTATNGAFDSGTFDVGVDDTSIALLSTVSCGALSIDRDGFTFFVDEGDPLAQPFADLLAARAAWRANAGRTYVIAYNNLAEGERTLRCVRGVAGDPWSVTDGAGIGAFGPLCEEQGFAFVDTAPRGVEGLFGLIARSFTSDPQPLEVSVDYDPITGVPMTIAIVRPDIDASAFETVEFFFDDGAAPPIAESVPVNQASLDAARARWQQEAPASGFQSEVFWMSYQLPNEGPPLIICVSGTAQDVAFATEFGSGCTPPGEVFGEEVYGVVGLFDLVQLALDQGIAVEAAFDEVSGRPLSIVVPGEPETDSGFFVTVDRFVWEGTVD